MVTTAAPPKPLSETQETIEFLFELATLFSYEVIVSEGADFDRRRTAAKLCEIARELMRKERVDAYANQAKKPQPPEDRCEP